MSNIITSMPYKMGDTIWSLAVAKAIAEKHNSKVDFATSNYCLPLLPLIQYQSWIDKAFIYHEFDKHIDNRPNIMWALPLDIPNYIIQYPIRFFPQMPTKWIPECLAEVIGVSINTPIRLDVPDSVPPFDRFITVNNAMGYGLGLEGQCSDLIHEVIHSSPLPVVVVGAKGEYSPTTPNTHVHDATGLDMLETAKIMQHAEAHIGLSSAHTALAEVVGIKQFVLMSSTHIKYWQIFHGESDSVPVIIDNRTHLKYLARAINKIAEGEPLAATP